MNLIVLDFSTTYKTAGTAKVRESRTRHIVLWVRLWVGNRTLRPRTDAQPALFLVGTGCQELSAFCNTQRKPPIVVHVTVHTRKLKLTDCNLIADSFEPDTTSSSNAQTVLDYAGQCELPDLLDRRTAHQRFRNQRRINREPSEPYGHSNCSRI